MELSAAKRYATPPGRARLTTSPSGHRVANRRRHDGNRVGGLLGCQGRWGTFGHDDGHVWADEVRRELGKPLTVSLRPPELDQNVLALN